MKKEKQTGIVLLSCLVFLLILTSLVKYTMSSAKMEELKAGADFDEMSAKEAALLAIKDAEDVILRRTYKLDPTTNSVKKYRVPHSNEVKDAKESDKTTVREDGEFAVSFWRNENNWKDRLNISGIYNGDKADDRCNDEICAKTQNSNLKGAWYKDTDCKDKAGPVICYGEYTGRTLIEKTRAKYIIEVFHPDGPVFGKVLAADPDGSNTMVLRVTAVGYSQDIKGKDVVFNSKHVNTSTSASKASIPNNTYALYQATYILSSD